MTHKDLAGERAFVAVQYDREREYWLDKLSGELQKTGIPPDHRITEESGKRFDAVTFEFPAPLSERLMDVVAKSDSRLYMALLTGFVLLLHKYTGHNDIIIGTPIDKQEVEGEFINTLLALRNRVEGEMTVRDLLMQVRQTVIEAGEHQNYPIETIPYELDIPVENGEFPLFDTAVLLRNIQDEQYIQHMNFNMIFSFLRTGEYIEGLVRYNTSLYEKETVERVIHHFLHLMLEIFGNVGAKLAEVSLLTGEEKHRILMDFNDTGADYPRDRIIHQLFEEQVAKAPGNIAVELKGETVTYEKLNRKANQLARLLREKGLKADITAAIILDSSIEVLIAVIAVLKAGGAYLPMGFEFPEERINYLLEDSEAVALLTRRSLVEEMSIPCPMIDMGDERIYTGGSENLSLVNGVDNLAYIIYTSGTTGQPKGVMVEQLGLMNYIWWAAEIYVKNEKADFPLYTSISFDLTVTSIFTPLVTGNTVIVYGGVDKKFYIEDVFENNRVDVVKLTPSHLKMIRHKQLKDSRIKRLIVGGEELEARLAREIYDNFAGDIEIYNEYGPTETVVGSMIYRFNPETDNTHSVPIGVPIANTQIYLLDPNLQPVPVGVAGELYISGDSVARGYLHKSGLTEEKFIANPFIPGSRMYRTGDLGIRLADGNIEYKGRIDHQVKIRGYRVETGEIETRIVEFQKRSHSRREQRENIVEKLDLKSITRCKTCLIPVNYPGGIHFDDEGVCDICREYETYKDKALNYYKTPADFDRVVKRAQETKRGKYDCLMLYSGGKDSSYVLHRLVDMGLKVLAFTFDNGYISETAFENIDRTTRVLNVDHIVLDSEAMKEIFVESLWSDYNVCNGCFKAVNTLGTKVAHEHDINLVVSGLTRGQIFDIKLHGLFKLGVFDEETIEERLKLFRRNYHSMTHRTSRLIGVEVTNEMLDDIYFTDYFRYEKISTQSILEYLEERDQGWVRPTDTGSSSSNCIINDVGIYVHLKDKGCHFYAAQLSWDSRFGTITRDEGIEELVGFRVDYPLTHRVLSEIGYYDAYCGAVVVDVEDQGGEKALCAYILADKDLEITELRSYLGNELPEYMIPTYFTRIDRIPLTAGGKVDRKALPEPKLTGEGDYVAPRDEVEEKLANVWAEVLGLSKESIGIDVNFFEVGGHSLRATFLSAAINKEFNVTVPLVAIFEAPTIRGLSEYINGAAKEIFISVSPAEKKEYYPLSSAQGRLFILQQMELNSTAYNANIAVEIEGEVDTKKFEDTFRELIRRHESMTTSFELLNGVPVQKVHNSSEIEFIMEYHEPGVDGAAAVNKILKKFVRAFELSRPPLIRGGLVKIGSSKYILVVDTHHIITDGVSHGIFIKDFIALYNRGELPPLAVQYKDYAQWQQSGAVKKTFLRQEKYWLRQFREEVPILTLPYDYPRPEVQSFEGGSLDFDLSARETGALNEMARAEGATLFMVLLGICNILLSKVGGREDIVVGTPIAGRRHADLEGIIGVFVNTLALRNYPSAESTFRKFLWEVRQNTLKVFENQDYPFEELVEKTVVQRDMSRNPLFDVLLILQNMFDPMGDISETRMEGLTVRPYVRESDTTQVDLTINSVEMGDRLFFRVEYCTRLFKTKTIESFIGYFKEIVVAVIEGPDKTIAEIEIVSQKERDRLLVEFNATAVEYPESKTVHQLFEMQVEKTPLSHAVTGVWLQGGLAIDGKPARKTLTYKELNEKANQSARELRSIGIGNGTLAAVLVERSIEMMIGIWAVMKAGGAYVPIDPLYPKERIRAIMENSGVSVLLTSKNQEEAVEYAGPRVELDDRRLYRSDGSNLENTAGPGDLVYVIYTSGSTGKPKGVMIEHRALNNFITGITDIVPFGNRDTILSLTTISFDIFGLESFLPLTRGSRMVVGTQEEQLNARAALNTIIEEEVTVLQVTPSRLQLLLSDADAAGGLKRLNHLLVGGEAFPRDLLEKAREVTEGKIYNMYGPTETTIWSTVKDVSPGETLDIGRPIANTQVYILGKIGGLQPIGTPGELCIAGAGLARGYIHNLELTKEKFPLNPYEPGQRLYRTGDMARWLPDGNLQFLGRRDHQVKIRGFRIELGEIESQLNDHPGLKEAVAVCLPIADGDKHICVYIVKAESVENPPAPTVLREYLSRMLPDYMIPGYFIPLEEIPLTPNGKINRNALPAPGIDPAEGYVAPGNEMEEKLAEIWGEELRIEKDIIGIDSNFFLLGGQSLKAIATIAKIHKAFNVMLQLTDMFRSPTIRGLSKSIKELAVDKYTAVEPAEKKEYFVLSPAQKRVYVLQTMDRQSTTYNMRIVVRLKGDVDGNRLEKTFKRLISRHENFRTSFEMMGHEPIQKIHDTVEFKIDYHDPGDAAEELIHDFEKPFDLARAPLLRVHLVKLEKENYLLRVDTHHILSDALSNRILIKDFKRLYSGEELPPLKLNYKDYSEWRRNIGTLKKMEAYWLKRFEGEIPGLNLPIDYDRSGAKGSKGDTIYFQTDGELNAHLKQLNRETGTTGYMVMLAVYTILLSKYSGREDVVVGSTTAGRSHADLQHIIGMFVNMLPIRNFPGNDKTFVQFLEEVKVNALDAFENQEYQFDELVAKLGIQRSPGRNPLFDVAIDFADIEAPEDKTTGMENPGLQIEPYPVERRESAFDLTLGITEFGGSLYFRLTYLTCLFKKETVEIMAGHLTRILEQVVVNPGVKISGIEMLTDEEKNNLLEKLRSEESQSSAADTAVSDIDINFNF